MQIVVSETTTLLGRLCGRIVKTGSTTVSDVCEPNVADDVTFDAETNKLARLGIQLVTAIKQTPLLVRTTSRDSVINDVATVDATKKSLNAA